MTTCRYVHWIIEANAGPRANNSDQAELAFDNTVPTTTASSAQQTSQCDHYELYTARNRG